MKYFLSALCLALLVGCSPSEKSVAPSAGNPVHRKGVEPLHIAHGQTVDLADYVVPGKTTVFDFTSKYCGPCQTYNEPLALLHAQRDDIVVVKVDINRPETKGIDWQSPVAQQYGMNSIPHFKVYGPDGKLIAEDTTRPGPARLMVNRWIETLK